MVRSQRCADSCVASVLPLLKTHGLTFRLLCTLALFVASEHVVAREQAASNGATSNVAQSISEKQNQQPTHVYQTATSSPSPSKATSLWKDDLQRARFQGQFEFYLKTTTALEEQLLQYVSQSDLLKLQLIKTQLLMYAPSFVFDMNAYYFGLKLLKFDLDGNGKLNLREFENFFSKEYGKKQKGDVDLARKRGESCFRLFVANSDHSDGQVSTAEILSGQCSQQCKLQQQERRGKVGEPGSSVLELEMKFCGLGSLFSFSDCMCSGTKTPTEEEELQVFSRLQPDAAQASYVDAVDGDSD